jgi:hypothetical protein
MTEAEWSVCDDPTAMLLAHRGQMSERKLRLFAVACCQRAGNLLQSRNFHNAIEVSERFADGLASDDTLRKARSQVRESAERTFRRVRASPWSRAVQSIFARSMVVSVCSRNIDEVLQAVGDVCVTANSSESYETKRKLEKQHQTALLREIVRYPLSPVTFSPEWRTDTAVSLARQMYDARDFSAMPILADALQDAGCDSDDILNHCRGPGPHVRGCWVCDLVLDKE